MGEQSVKTSLGQCGSMYCARKPSPICRHRAPCPFRQSLSPPSSRACRSWCCPLPILATSPSSNISRTGLPRI
jgi:hypothetical protein